MRANATPSPDSLVELLNNARTELLGATEGLDDDQLRRRDTDGWSVRDILAHVAMWDEMELLEIRRCVRGGASVFEHRFDEALIHQWNSIQFELRSQLPLAQVRADLDFARDELIHFVGSLAARRVPGFVSTACAVQAKHDRDHAGHIRAWREREGI